METSWYKVIGALIIAGVLYAVIMYLIARNRKKSAGVTTPPPTKTPKNWGKILRWMVFLVVTGTVLFLWYKHIEVKDRLVAEIRTAKVTTPKEEWFYTWRLAPGKYHGSRNSHTLSLEITKDTDSEFWAIMHDDGGKRLGGLRLDKKDRDLIGTWSNYLDGDGGECYLYYEADGIWSGYNIDQQGSKTHISLKRK